MDYAEAKEIVTYRRKLEAVDFADYLDMELIARRSDVVNSLIYYPFILLTLMLASRLAATDSYQWPLGFLVMIGVNTAWAIYCAVRLPIEAGQARQRSLERLRQRLFERTVAEREGRKFRRSSTTALAQVIEKIEHMNRGAFVGIWEQPILRALLVPSSSAGLWALLELLPH